MKKRSVLVIALLLGLASSVGAYLLMRAYDGGEAEIPEMVTVVVATKDILPKERITIGDVKVKEISREMAHFEAATTTEQVVGLYVKDQLLAGEQILKPRLIRGFEDYGIVIKIPVGQRAMTIPVNNEMGVSGFIRPGDYLDILAGFNELVMGENIAQVILEKILVLATDRQLSEEERQPQDMENITVAVTLDQAEKLAMALEHGSVRVVLRPIESFEMEGKENSLSQVVSTVKKSSTATTNKSSTTKSGGKKQLSKLSIPPQPAPKPLSTSAKSSEVRIQKESQATTKVVDQNKQIEIVRTVEPYLIEVIRGIERNLVTVEDE